MQHFNFNATCAGDYTGAPKFLVGGQQWKVTVNDSRITGYDQNDSSTYLATNSSVYGDIGLGVNNPDGSVIIHRKE